MQINWLKKNKHDSNELKFFFFLGVSHFIVLFLGLMSNVIWTRWMPIEVFGNYRLIFSILSIVGTFCLIGIGQGVLMSASGSADGNFSKFVRQKLNANVLGMLSLFCISVYYYISQPDSQMIAFGLLAAGLIFPFYNTSELWLSWLNGKSKFFELATAKSVSAVLSFLTLLFIAYIQPNPLWLIVLAMLILPAIYNLFMIRFAMSIRQNNKNDKELMTFSKHASLAFIFTGLLPLDIVLLEHFYSAKEVAIYAIALVLPEKIKGLVSIIGQLISPKLFANKNLQFLWNSLKYKFLFLLAIFSFLGIVGFILIPKIVILLFSIDYAYSGELGSWLWLTLCSTGPISLLGTTLLATKKPIYLYTPSVIYPCSLLALFFLFIDYGVSGMIYIRCFGALILALYYLSFFFFELKKDAG